MVFCRGFIYETRYGKDLSLKWTTRTGTRVIGEGSASDSLKDNLFYYGLTILVE